MSTVPAATRANAAPRNARHRHAHAWLSGLILLGCSVAHAGTYTVTNLNDNGSGSLRAALNSANNTNPNDTVVFSPTLSGTIVLAIPLTVGGKGTLEVIGSERVSVSGNKRVRIANIPRDAHVTLTGLRIHDGAANTGGCIFNRGNLTLNTAYLTACRTTATAGGAIINAIPSHLVVIDSSLDANHAVTDGGAIANEQGATVLLQGARLRNNSAGGKGGAIANAAIGTDVMVIEDSQLSGNFAQTGGTISNSGALVVRRSRLIDGLSGDFGAGIHTRGASLASPALVQISQSTLMGNWSRQGGGIYSRNSNLLVDNTTIAQNVADTGGGIDMGRGVLTLTNVTLAGNIAPSQPGGGLRAVSDGTVYINNSILADNVAAATNPDCMPAGGTIIVNRSIIKGGLDCAWQINQGTAADPMLAPLMQVAGTYVHPLQPGSLAIDAGNNALVDPASTQDQTGAARIVNSVVDMGAYEFAGP